MPVKQAHAPEETAPVAAPAIIGHNKPPLEEIIPEEFRAELLRERPEFLTKLDDAVDAAGRAKAVDDETLGRCGDLVNVYRAMLKHIDATHKTVKEPYLQGGRIVDAEKKALAERVEGAKRQVEAVGNAYAAKRAAEQRAEQERIAAEQRAAAERAAAAERERERAEREAALAQQQAANAEERAAADYRARKAAEAAEEAMSAAVLAPAASKAPEPVRSDGGSTISGKQEWQSQVTDYQLAFMAVEDDEKVREAIDKAIARRVRAGTRKIEGVTIYPVAKANFR
jgi:hypothetical protein